jgi:hypothetical protein
MANIVRLMADELARECGGIDEHEAEYLADRMRHYTAPPYTGQVIVFSERVGEDWQFRVAYARGMQIPQQTDKPYSDRPVINTYTVLPEKFTRQDDAVEHAGKLWDSNPVWTEERTKGFYQIT